MQELVDITIQGNFLVPDSEIAERLGLHRGMSISTRELAGRVEEVNRWGGFGELSHNTAPLEGGIALNVSVDERLELRAIELRGNRAVPERHLMRAVALEPGEVLDHQAIQSARERMLAHYSQSDYVLASVEFSGRFHEDGTFTLVFDIAEGRRMRVRRINVSGNRAFSELRLRRIMDTHVYLPLPFIRRGRFDRDVFIEDLRKIERRYYAAGYLDAKAAGYWTYTDEFDGYELNVVVYEGLRYRISDIEVEGNLLFRNHEIVERSGAEAGDVFTPALTERVERNISHLYATQGLVDVTAVRGNLAVTSVVHPDEGLVDIRIRITETEPVYVRRIRVEGLTRTEELVVLRHLRFEPGDRVDQSAFNASRRALIDTGYFDLASPDPVDITLAPGTGRFRDVIVTVKEGPTGNLMLGGGVSSDAGFMGNLSITERNFDIRNLPRSWSDFRHSAPLRGGGQQLSLNLMFASERVDFEISFREPRIRHTDYSLGVKAYSRLSGYRFFNLLRSGAGVSLGRRLGDHVYRQVEVGGEHIDVTRMSGSAPPEIARDRGTYLKPYIDLSLRRDTRDSIMFPTTGYVARVGTELSMYDIKTVKLTGSVERYWPAYVQENNRKHVFMLRGSGGVMGSYGRDGRIPVFERFYGGGMGSIRGFEYWGVSPVEPEREEQVGGKSMLTGTAEYTIPLFTDMFRVAFFVDAGYVEEKAGNVFSGWDRLRVSSGAGIRWLMPALGGIPLTLDVAFPHRKEDYDVTRNLHFHLGLGHSF